MSKPYNFLETCAANLIFRRRAAVTAPRVNEHYQPGYFLCRAVKSGPLMPARIWRPCCCTVGGGADNDEHAWTPECDRYPPLVAEIAGEPADIYRVWMSRTEITEAEYRLKLDQAIWDQHNDPDAPFANPTRAVNLRDLPPVF